MCESTKIDCSQASNSDDSGLLLTADNIAISYMPTPITNWENFLETEQIYFKMRMNLKIPGDDLRKEDFKFIKCIGQGAFGKVVLAKRRIDNCFYAAKVINKKDIMLTKTMSNILNEQRILTSIRFPFTIYLEFFFQDRNYMYFILPLLAGGNLYRCLKQTKKFEENVAAFYAAQVVLALEYLHYMNLIYRDLKLENILLDHDGYVKIGDFGFCRFIKDRMFTICGTSEYAAPEMLQYIGYNIEVDWWALGVLIFELCFGKTPFHSNDKKTLFRKIQQVHYNCPPFFSDALQDLIWHLLEKDVKLRYGNSKHGVNDIKNHRWFQEIRWLPLVNRQLPPPMLPLITLRSGGSKSFEFDQLVSPEKPTAHTNTNFKDF